MGAAAGPVGSALSLASVGLSAYGDVTKSQGVNAADQARASQLERAADRGRTAAVETGGQMTEALNITLGNIAAVRAAAHTDITSPTSAAVLDQQQSRGERTRDISVENLMAQAEENDASAHYMRQAGAYALSQGKFSAFATILKGAGGAVSPTFGFGGGGGGGGDIAATGRAAG